MAKRDPEEDALAAYRAKRDFDETPEPPAGETPRPRAARQKAATPTFVVQKHDARTLHYDFRLEVDGVLKSWAVRKGPSTDPAQKRLAIPTEDHPLAYADFEGIIPSGYGAGTVIVWDRGTYRNLREGEGRSMQEALEEGKVVVWLEGEKLRGGYTLVQMKGRDGWLLIKQQDEEANATCDVTTTKPTSVLSGRTIEEVRGESVTPPTPKEERAPQPTPVRSRKASSADRKKNVGTEIHVGRYTVEVTNADRVLFPESGITKGDLVDYYRRIADRMLPYVEHRPLTLNRYPKGIAEEGFVQQHAPEYYPDWIARVTVEKAEGTVTHAVADNAATLVYLANQGVIALHVWLSRMDKLHRPDRLIFDLDPPGDEPGSTSGAGFEPVRQAARATRALLDELDLPSFLMTTGSSGLHVIVPLDRSADFDTARDFARDAAEQLAHRHPDLLTTEQRKSKRGGRVFLDVMRNTYAHTAVAPYAVRARPGAPVATPLNWDELKSPQLHAGRYTVENLFQRLVQTEDPWAGMSRRACSLGAARPRLDALAKESR